MIPLIKRDHVCEHDPGRFCTEASTLQIFPGEVWPMRIKTDLGNGQDFKLIHTGDERARYTQEYGCIDLVVFND